MHGEVIAIGGIPLLVLVFLIRFPMHATTLYRVYVGEGSYIIRFDISVFQPNIARCIECDPLCAVREDGREERRQVGRGLTPDFPALPLRRACPTNNLRNSDHQRAASSPGPHPNGIRRNDTIPPSVRKRRSRCPVPAKRGNQRPPSRREGNYGVVP